MCEACSISVIVSDLFNISILTSIHFRLMIMIIIIIIIVIFLMPPLLTILKNKSSDVRLFYLRKTTKVSNFHPKILFVLIYLEHMSIFY